MEKSHEASPDKVDWRCPVYWRGSRVSWGNGNGIRPGWTCCPNSAIPCQCSIKLPEDKFSLISTQPFSSKSSTSKLPHSRSPSQDATLQPPTLPPPSPLHSSHPRRIHHLPHLHRPFSQSLGSTLLCHILHSQSALPTHHQPQQRARKRRLPELELHPGTIHTTCLPQRPAHRLRPHIILLPLDISRRSRRSYLCQLGNILERKCKNRRQWHPPRWYFLRRSTRIVYRFRLRVSDEYNNLRPVFIPRRRAYKSQPRNTMRWSIFPSRRHHQRLGKQLFTIQCQNGDQ
jgi:hypothetical protein